MNIAGREIGKAGPPYLIAEMSGEHCGFKDSAINLISMALWVGADAIKLQCFDPSKLAEARGGADKVLTEGLWAGRALGDLYRETHTPREWFPDLFAYAKRIGITLFASVFDEEGVDFLETLGCPAYKISSFSLTDLALIRKAASTGRPLLISTGMASEDEIEEGVYQAGGLDNLNNVAVLHCVSAYPCSIESAGLHRIGKLIEDHHVVGLSDHTLGSIAPIVATALGASIIEKHITLDRKNGGPDAPFSLEPQEFKQMVSDVKDAYASLGDGEVASHRPKSEDIYKPLRRKTG